MYVCIHNRFGSSTTSNTGRKDVLLIDYPSNRNLHGPTPAWVPHVLGHASFTNTPSYFFLHFFSRFFKFPFLAQLQSFFFPLLLSYTVPFVFTQEIVGASVGSLPTSSNTVGASVGSATGTSVGSTTGDAVGSITGALVGSTTGDSVGSTTGVAVGSTTGAAVGTVKGDLVGLFVGLFVGDLVGDLVGDPVGDLVGVFVGGVFVGDTVGALVGETVGSGVGLGVGSGVCCNVPTQNSCVSS